MAEAGKAAAEVERAEMEVDRAAVAAVTAVDRAEMEVTAAGDMRRRSRKKPCWPSPRKSYLRPNRRKPAPRGNSGV